MAGQVNSRVAGTSVQLQCVRESMSMDKLKIIIELHEGEKSTKKSGDSMSQRITLNLNLNMRLRGYSHTLRRKV